MTITKYFIGISFEEYSNNCAPPLLPSKDIMPKIENVMIPELEITSLSIIDQYFLAPFLFLNTEFMLTIPATSEQTLCTIFSRIAPHFSLVKKVSADNQFQVMLQQPKQKSLMKLNELHVTNQLHPIIRDLYAADGYMSTDDTDQKYYKVDLASFPANIDNTVTELWELLQETYLAVTGKLVLLPNKWHFNNELSNRIALQSLAAVSSSMVITVSGDKVLSVSIH